MEKRLPDMTESDMILQPRRLLVTSLVYAYRAASPYAYSASRQELNDCVRDCVQDCVQAFESGNKLMVEQLLPRIQQPAVVRTTSESLWYRYNSITVANVSLLHLAARWGWIDIAVLLVTEHNCSVVWRDEYENIPLHYAAYYGHLELVKYFITELHCDPTDKNRLNETPLHLTCWNGHLNIAQYLISELHCNPSCVNRNGKTPLHLACRNGHLNIAQYLISEALSWQKVSYL